MKQCVSPLLIQSNTNDWSISDFCSDRFCSCCSHCEDVCMPLGWQCSHQDEMHQLFNAMWLSSLAENAMYDYDEDDPVGSILEHCWEEQECICDELSERITRLVED